MMKAKKQTKEFKDSKFSKEKKQDFKEKRQNDKKDLHATSGFKSCNDIKWYSQNPSMLKDAGSVQFAQILGLNAPLSAQTKDGTFNPNYVIPGIMTIDYIPGVGVSTDVNSNINVAARLLYTFVRHANSGSRNYEAPDLMTYCLGVANAQAFYAYMVRLYGLINHHSVMNRYITRALVTAAGGDYDNLVANMAAFRYYINNFANKLNSLAVPKDQYYFDRMTFLPLHVFTDGEDVKSQMYVFKPKGFYKWDGSTYETGSALKFELFNAEGTLDYFITKGTAIINALLENEDIGIMSGDILKAFGADGIRQIAMIPSEYSTPIIKDDGMLSQIHNANTMTDGSTILTSSLDITQEDGVLKYGLKATQRTVMRKLYLDSWFKEPGPDYVMEATRLQSLWKYEEGSDAGNPYNSVLVTSGTEVVTSITIYNFNPSGQLQYSTYYNVVSSSSFSINDIRKIDELSKFDWHPIMYFTYESGPNANPVIGNVFPVGDLQNYTIIDSDMLDRLHNCAIQSLFNVFGLYIRTK